jgi:Zn-dependent M28 family amino/carboxypeptidase
MLEAARALSCGPPLNRPVVLLFNGAEETNQQGSHGFITQHRWAAEVG